MGFFLVAATVMTGVSVILALDKIGKELVDPVAIASAVKKIGFKGTPAGYTVPHALALPLMELLVMERSADKQMVYLLRNEKDKPGNELEDSRSLQNLTSVLFARDGQPLSLSEDAEKGKIEIRPGGAKLEYKMGSLTDPKSTVYSGLVGFVRSGKKLLIVEAVKPGANTFDKASVLELLQQMDGL